MSPRALRRAVERHTLTVAAQTPHVLAATAADADQPLSPVDPIGQISDARLAANRANSQLSTGPRTPEGKATSSLNAVKTGLTGRTVLLTTDDAVIYQQHLDRHFSEFSPATDKEKALVQTIADTEWRLLRIAPLEASIYAIGRRKLADLVAGEPDLVNREALLLGEIFLTYRKDLNNLALQERRLRSHRQADVAELQALQQERVQRRSREIECAVSLHCNASKHRESFDPADHGFDFSLSEFEAYLKRANNHFSVTEFGLDFDAFLAAYRAGQKEVKAG